MQSKPLNSHHIKRTYLSLDLSHFKPYFDYNFSDMDVKLWDMNNELNPNLYTYKNHTEFVIGVDYSMFS